MTAQRLSDLIRTVWKHHKSARRDMPWRADTRPYYVVVSEVMLQQTQVDRVIRKFPSFIRRFPDWQSLADAPTADVLREWSGLGYNRRALYLKEIAETVVRSVRYHFLMDTPPTRENSWKDLHQSLHALSGIGPNTAGSILAFAFNIPYPFIETNIRSVFIHHLFPRTKRKISDNQLMPLIERALQHPKNRKNPREWYYALMDYGSALKRQTPNPSRRSAHHTRQNPFKGSNRELRSRILKLIMSQPCRAAEVLSHFQHEKISHEQISKNLIALKNEGFLTKKGSRYSVTA